MNANVTAVPGHRIPSRSAVHEQRELGFWLYLMGDAVIFALLFMTYGIMVGNTAGGPPGKQLFSLNNAAIETALLLISSTTFGFASLSSRAGQPLGGAGAGCSSPSCWARASSFLEIREFLGMIRPAPGPTAAASCRPSSPWSAPTAPMSASA